MSGALQRFRVLAWTVGTLLIVLFFVGVPLDLVGIPVVAKIVGPVHGLLFMVYLVAMLDLARRMRWPLWRLLQLALCGVVPGLSFYAERGVTRQVRARMAAELASGIPPRVEPRPA